MTVEVRDFTVTIPAGTAISAGFTADMSFPARIVTQINIRVPPGPRGEVGFAVGTGGENIVPYGNGTWIVTDDEDLSYELTSTIESGAWELLAYNTGSFDHTLRVYFYCDVVTGTGGAGSGGITPITGVSGGDGGGEVTPPVITPPVITPPVITPPVITPPVTVTPPVITAPVLLPPAPIAPPGTKPAPAPESPEQVLIGITSLSQVWLLDDGVYIQMTDQDTVNALIAAGIIGVQVSADTHDELMAASRPSITIDLGYATLSGSLVSTAAKG